jgi:hypothetical protein
MTDGIYSAAMPIPALDSLLRTRRKQWTVFEYRYLYEKTQELPIRGRGDNIRENYIHQSDFEKHLRVYRNSDYWIAPADSVFRYLAEKKSSGIQTERFKNVIYLKVTNSLDPLIYKQALTVLYRTGAQRIRISGSESDGFYNNRNGIIRFNVIPEKEVSIEILE